MECTADEVIGQSSFVLVDVVEHLTVDVVGGTFKTVVFAEAAAVDTPDTVADKEPHLICAELGRALGEKSHTVVPAPVVNVGGETAFDFILFPLIKVFLRVVAKLNDDIGRGKSLTKPVTRYTKFSNGRLHDVLIGLHC